MNDNQETIADIVAEMRDAKSVYDRYRCGGADCDAIDTSATISAYADCIEAAAKRDAAIHAMTCEANERLREHLEIALENNKGTVGNAAAIREACVNIVEYARSARCHTDDAHVLGFLDQIERWAQAAISKPLKNCDLYNDVEDSWRDYKQFRSQKGEDIYFDMVHFWPFAK